MQLSIGGRCNDYPKLLGDNNQAAQSFMFEPVLRIGPFMPIVLFVGVPLVLATLDSDHRVLGLVRRSGGLTSQ